jgi:hypothetical protein
MINGDIFELLLKDASSVFREILQIFANRIVLHRQIYIFERLFTDYFLFFFSKINCELPGGAVRNI